MSVRLVLFAQKLVYALARFWYPLLLSIPIIVFILGFLDMVQSEIDLLYSLRHTGRP